MDRAETLGIPGGQPQRVASGTLAPKFLTALGQLAEARGFAEDAGRGVWDFSVEMDALGLKPNDVRWLICKGYVAHARETTRRGADRRSFRPGGQLTFTSRSCFVVTDAGLLLARSQDGGLNAADSSEEQVAACEGDGHAPLPPPHWDAQRRELRIGLELVKQYRLPSPNQETILAGFEEEGWPATLDDPLPPHPEQDPKRRLHETIRSLNRHQKHPLIRFTGDGTGQRVLWERIVRGGF